MLLRAGRDVLLTVALAFVLAKTFRALYLASISFASGLPWTYSMVFPGPQTFLDSELRERLSHFVFAPLVETAVFFVGPWLACVALGLRRRWFVLGCLLAFSALHLRLGGYEAVSAVLVGGAFAGLFLRYAGQVHLVGVFWLVAIAHSLYNLLVSLI